MAQSSNGQPNRFGKLVSEHGRAIDLAYLRTGLQDLARHRAVDTYIASQELGYSPLGFNSDFLCSDLGMSKSELYGFAHDSIFKSDVALICIPSRRKKSTLRGLILVTAGGGQAYRSVGPHVPYGPNRDFYYSVTYEAIAYASQVWAARRLALSHFSPSGQFHIDIATCNAEALAHFCDATPECEIEQLTFLGCCIDEKHLAGISRLNAEAGSSRHRPIRTETENRAGSAVVRLFI